MQTHAGDAVSNLLTHAESIAVAMLHAFGMCLSVTDTTGICPPTSGAVCSVEAFEDAARMRPEAVKIQIDLPQ